MLRGQPRAGCATCKTTSPTLTLCCSTLNGWLIFVQVIEYQRNAFFYQSEWEQTKFDEFVCKRGKSKCFSSKQHHNFRFQFETPFSVIPACSISSASTYCFYATDEIYKSEYCLLYATTHQKTRARALERKTCLLTATVAKMDRMGSNLVTLCCERGWKNRNQLQPPALKRLGVAV